MSVAKSSGELNLVFLVVDDDDGARQIICDYLTAFGYKNIIQAKDGKHALQELEVNKVDFVISDWDMPEVTGFDLLMALKNDERFRHIPFVIVTSPISSEKSKVVDAATQQVDGYILKPFRAEVLREKIDRALGSLDIAGRSAALVVDDDDDVRSTIVEYLKKMGQNPIFEAHDGEEGFQVLKANADKIAFVVSDWEMPKLAGIDLLKAIRSDPELSKMPFIMVTSQSSIERLKLQQALESDVDNYLLKPFKGDDLKAKVEQVLLKAKAQVHVGRDLKRAQDLAVALRWSDALKAYGQALAIDQNNIPALIGIANAQKHLAPEKAIPKATQFLRQAINVNPQCEEAHIDLALIFESAMSIDKAITTMKEALTTCPFSALIHYHLGRLLLRRGLQVEGVKELRAALQLKPDLKEAEELLSGRSE